MRSKSSEANDINAMKGLMYKEISAAAKRMKNSIEKNWNLANS